MGGRIGQRCRGGREEGRESQIDCIASDSEDEERRPQAKERKQLLESWENRGMDFLLVWPDLI